EPPVERCQGKQIDINHWKHELKVSSVHIIAVSIFSAPERHPMKRLCWSVGILFACAFAAQAQSRPVKAHLHVILVDSELNQKPVPFLNVTLKGAATSSDVKTRLDGVAETTLPPGTYTVTTAKPVDFDGKRYSWSLRMTLTGAEKSIDLTNENANVEDN